MNQIVIWKRLEAKPEWGWWTNVYTLDGGQSNSLGGAGDVARILMDFESGLTRTDTEIICGATRSGFGDVNQFKGNAFGTALPLGHGKGFRRPATGEPLWRYVLGMKKETQWGRPSHAYYRNCISEDEIKHDKNGRMELKEWQYFEQYLADWTSMHKDTLWRREVSMRTLPFPLIGQEIVPCRKRFGPFAADMHAQTRWRRRRSQNGETQFDALRKIMLECEKQILANKEMIDYNIDFVPADYYDKTTALLGSGKVVHDKLKDFFKDADNDSNNGEEAPLTRFGPTGGDILDAWFPWKTFVDQTLDNLKQQYHPEPFYDGRDYIKSWKLKIFDDQLQELIKPIGIGWFFDWYNPFAYEKNSENWMDSSQTPDLIELAY